MNTTFAKCGVRMDKFYAQAAVYSHLKPLQCPVSRVRHNIALALVLPSRDGIPCLRARIFDPISTPCPGLIFVSNRGYSSSEWFSRVVSQMLQPKVYPHYLLAGIFVQWQETRAPRFSGLPSTKLYLSEIDLSQGRWSVELVSGDHEYLTTTSKPQRKGGNAKRFLSTSAVKDKLLSN